MEKPNAMPYNWEAGSIPKRKHNRMPIAHGFVQLGCIQYFPFIPF